MSDSSEISNYDSGSGEDQPMTGLGYMQMPDPMSAPDFTVAFAAPHAPQPDALPAQTRQPSYRDNFMAPVDKMALKGSIRLFCRGLREVKLEDGDFGEGNDDMTEALQVWNLTPAVVANEEEACLRGIWIGEVIQCEAGRIGLDVKDIAEELQDTIEVRKNDARLFRRQYSHDEEMEEKLLEAVIAELQSAM